MGQFQSITGRYRCLAALHVQLSPRMLRPVLAARFENLGPNSRMRALMALDLDESSTKGL